MKLCSRQGLCRVWLLVALLPTCAVLWSVSSARADEASGTWTGQLEGRGNYFWERSTRVIVPAAKVSLESPNGVRMSAAYLVDVISSASIAGGVSTDGVFTELRHGVGLGTGKRFALGDNELDLSAHGIFSTENDYKSWLYGIHGTFAWNDRNSALSLGLTRVDDTITSNADPLFKRPLGGLTTSLAFSQVVSPVLTLGLGYQLVYLEGFLGNPYRRTLTMGQAPTREAPPEQRVRHNAEGEVRWFLPATETALVLHARVYIDSWNLLAVTPELRVYQRLSDALNVRLRYRFYTQSRADFALPDGETRYAAGYKGATTNDPKLSEFHSQQVGARFELSLAALEATFLRFASAGVLDLSMDYQWCTSAFGNNVIGTVGGRLPF